MAQRPDKREKEMLGEENLKELRHNLAHLSLPAALGILRTGVSRLPPRLRPSSQPTPDTDTRTGVEATVELVVSICNIAISP
jgi:hypothetical protein